MFRICLDYFGISILAAIAFTAVEYVFSINMPSGTVVSVIAGMVAGQLYGGRTGQEVSSVFAWKVAFILTALSCVLLVLFLVLLNFFGESLPIGGISIYQLLVIVLVAGLIGVLIIRFTFRWGVKMGAKHNPKRTDPEIFD